MDTDLLGKFLKSASQRKAGGDDTNESIPMDVEALNEQLSQLSTEQLQALAQMTGSGDLKSSLGTSQDTDPTFRSFIPEPGFCLKTKSSANQKIFINLCKSVEINAPKDISEMELTKLVERNDLESAAFHFRVPMSLGEPHDELDNAGAVCVAYDVCINSKFFQKVMESTTFMSFLITIVLEGLENKYSLQLDRNCIMLKNKKFLGKIQKQYIRSKSKPLIAEVAPNDTSKNTQENKTTKPAIEEKKGETPKYKIFREPSSGKVEYLVAEIELPNIISAKSIELDIGEDRLVINTRSGQYHLDIFLPFTMNQAECGAQFDKKSRLLTITIPVINND